MHEQNERVRQPIGRGFMVFAAEGEAGIGSVREVREQAPELVVYIENAGDFDLPLSAVKSVHDDKVVLDCEQLDAPLRKAVTHARDAEYSDNVVTNTEDGKPIDE
jgi:hypothetical protein